MVDVGNKMKKRGDWFWTTLRFSFSHMEDCKNLMRLSSECLYTVCMWVCVQFNMFIFMLHCICTSWSACVHVSVHTSTQCVSPPQDKQRMWLWIVLVKVSICRGVFILCDRKGTCRLPHETTERPEHWHGQSTFLLGQRAGQSLCVCIYT